MTLLLLMLLVANVGFGVFNVTQRFRNWEACVALNVSAAIAVALAIVVRVA